MIYPDTRIRPQADGHYSVEMPSFAQRMGHRPTRSLVQSEDLDDETRIEMWNAILLVSRLLAEKDHERDSFDNVTSAIWAWQFKKPRDEQPGNGQFWAIVKNQILSGTWFDALDLVEAIVGYVDRFKNWQTEEIPGLAVDLLNNVFETHLVGYRIINLKLIPIDSPVEADAVEDALESTNSIKGARHHLERAAELFADRKAPDYPNSIKESISAVEAVCVSATGRQTLGEALKKLKDAGVKIHPALESAWTKMYGWTSDADGIRHGGIDAPDSDAALAKYMLVVCSAFVSHIIEVARISKLI